MNLAATTFDLANACECAISSAAAYLHAPLSGTHIQAANTDTHCLVIEQADHIVIAFRGTASIRNWITDAKFERTVLVQTPDHEDVLVHAGFLAAFDSILPALTAHLKSIVASTRKIFVTGHSLGGALAILCALELKRQQFDIAQVYTFGQPRVGNAAFKELYEIDLGARTWRVVYEEDIVARLPHFPSFNDPYRHVGSEAFISSLDGGILLNPGLGPLLLSDICGVWRAWIVGKFAAAEDPIVDHHISNYTRELTGAAAFGNS